eukprot:355285-Chlamydomonas_euryale.AAC.6
MHPFIHPSVCPFVRPSVRPSVQQFTKPLTNWHLPPSTRQDSAEDDVIMAAVNIAVNIHSYGT